MTPEQAVIATCEDIYRKTMDFFAKIKRSPDYGYKIFNSPPKYKAQVLFIGYQPGGGAGDAEVQAGLKTHLRWPAVSEYATADWTLARNLRRMFGPELDFHDCVGLNAIFLRYPSVSDYTRALDRTTRREIQQFCAARVVQIIDLLQPKKIVVIGFETLRLFSHAHDDKKSHTGRMLTRTGNVGERNATAMLHLSGARISKTDRDLIRARILAS